MPRIESAIFRPLYKQTVIYLFTSVDRHHSKNTFRYNHTRKKIKNLDLHPSKPAYLDRCLLVGGACLVRVDFNAFSCFWNSIQDCLEQVACLIEVTA